MELIIRAANFSAKNAVFCRQRTFTYGDLLAHAELVRNKLLSLSAYMKGKRVVVLTPHSYEYLPCQWGIWKAGGVVVPINIKQPPLEWKHIIEDCRPTFILCHGSLLSRLETVIEKNGVKIIPVGDFQTLEEKIEIKDVNMDNETDAMILYTAGITGKPKGAVHTHRSLTFQVKTLSNNWGWNENDNCIELMPLYHYHGVSSLLSALWAGASVTFHYNFDVWNLWQDIKKETNLTVLSAPTSVYTKLLYNWNYMYKTDKQEIIDSCRRFRLMITGSCGMPETMSNYWEEATKHALINQYGTAETGMVLSNLANETQTPGCVGKPLTQIETEIYRNELKVKTPGMFKEYFNNPESTKQAFDNDGWFKTGDLAEIDPRLGNYRITGKLNSDAIRFSGYTISAREIETELKGFPGIEDVAAVGVPSYEHGEIIGVAIKSQKKITLKDVQIWCKTRMASYKLPRVLQQLDQFPLHSSGKINKNELVNLFRQ
ncbi:unnamed protein product [Blepharisma stoltei]|uniref:Uncharacterized protein n=1 Tax=Blepharisma stoltei TaxID=1481888 RepID=A0AAU9IHD0_9CILI|nr:unnamed protein product [Blepharisma stoltei]